MRDEESDTGRPRSRPAGVFDTDSQVVPARVGSAHLSMWAESARAAGSSILGAAVRWKDPRTRHLARIRRAKRRGVRFGSAAATAAVGTAGMAVLSAPEWTLLLGGGSAALAAVPAAFAATRLRRLRAQPLPVGTPPRRVLPPRGFAAYRPIARLAGAERSLFELIGILARSDAVGADEVEEIIAVAATAADGLEAMAVDISALERAGSASAVTRRYLDDGIETAAADLAAGVDQYEQLVVAAAAMTGHAGSASTAVVRSHRQDLLSATDRLQGWAEAIDEVARISARHR